MLTDYVVSELANLTEEELASLQAVDIPEPVVTVYRLRALFTGLSNFVENPQADEVPRLISVTEGQELEVEGSQVAYDPDGNPLFDLNEFEILETFTR